MVLPGFVLGCHDLGMFWDRFWARFGHVLANVGDTGLWLEHGKSMEKTRHWQEWLFATFPLSIKRADSFLKILVVLPGTTSHC